MTELWDFIGKNTAELIACFAFGVAVWQGIATRQHNKLSVFPHLVFEHLESFGTQILVDTLHE